MTVQAKRTVNVEKLEKLARIYDAEIAPYWGARFGRMLLRELAVPARSQVLDVSCGTGAPTIEILRRMTEGSRLIAIDESSAMLDIVRRKVAALGPLDGRGVFFRTESAVPKLSFADEVYDLVVCNLGVHDMPSSETALRDFARVAKPGGEVRVTLPLAGTFAEFHDLYREVLVKHDKHDALDRLEMHLASYPTAERAERWLVDAGLIGHVEVEEFALLFRSSREFFFAPVIEFGPLAAWKAIAGDGQEMQDVFWYIKEAIDAYFGGRTFEVTVNAGCLIGKKPGRPDASNVSPAPRYSAGYAAQSYPAYAPYEDPPAEQMTVGLTDDDLISMDSLSFERVAPERLSTEGGLVERISDRISVDRLSVDRFDNIEAALDSLSADRVSRDSLGEGVITTPVPLSELDAPYDDAPFPELDSDMAWPPDELASGSVRADDELDAIEELASGDFALDEDSLAEQELDAFIAGRKRSHRLPD